MPDTSPGVPISPEQPPHPAPDSHINGTESVTLPPDVQRKPFPTTSACRLQTRAAAPVLKPNHSAWATLPACRVSVFAHVYLTAQKQAFSWCLCNCLTDKPISFTIPLKFMYELFFPPLGESSGKSYSISTYSQVIDSLLILE